MIGWDRSRRVRSFVLGGFLAALVFGAAGAAAADEPGAGADYAFVQQPGTVVPGTLVLREADGRSVAVADLAGGRPLIVALGYFHCPSLCGVVRDDLLAALSATDLAAGSDYELAVVSIDPAETPADAAAALADDRRRYPAHGSDRWHFLTGDAASVATLEEAVGFRSRYDIHLRQFLHPAGLVVLTADRRVSSYVLGVGYRPGDVAAALAVAGTGGIAKAALPILLICFHYDAVTGRYSLEILKVLRLGAALTVLGILGIVLLLWRQDRRNKAI